MKRFLPGQIDGLLLFSVVVCLAVQLPPWVTAYTFFEDVSWWQMAAITGSGCAVAAFSVLVDLWLFLSDRNLIQRHATALLLTIPVALCCALSVEWMCERDPSQAFSSEHGILASCFLFFGITRWATVCGLTLLSIPIQAITRWRIVDQQTNNQKRTTITHIMLLMASFAIAIGVMRPVYQHVEAVESVQTLAALATLEVFLVLVFVLLPTLFACFSNRLRVHYVKSIITFGALIGVPLLLSIPTLISREWLSPGVVMQQYRTYGVFIAFFAIGANFARTAGFRFQHVTRPELNQPRPESSDSVLPAFRWQGVVIAAALLATTWVFHQRYDPLPFLCEEDFGEAVSTSRKVKRISRVAGTPDSNSGGYGSYYWNAVQSGRTDSEVVFDRFAFQGFQSYEAILKPLTRGEQKANYVQLNQSNEISPKSLELLSQLHSIDYLEINSDAVDAVSLGKLLAKTKTETLELNCEVSASHVAAIDKGQVEHLTLGRLANADRQQIEILRGKPVWSLGIRFRDSETISLRGFNELTELSVYDSSLTNEFFDGIAQCPNLERLDLRNCDFSAAVACRIKDLDIEFVTIEFKKDSDIDPNELMPIADNPSIVQIQFSTTGKRPFGPLFGTRFDLRNGKSVSEVLHEDEYVEDLLTADGGIEQSGLFTEEPASVLAWAVAKYGSFERAISEVAHHVKRNGQGEIVDLDLQWISISEQNAKQIAQLPALKRFRCSSRYFESYENLFTSRSIESLEIPNFNVPDEAVAPLSKMTQLRRLQLPLMDQENNYYSYINKNQPLAHPEQIPIPVKFAELSWNELEETRAEQTADGYTMSAAEFTKLKSLSSLEYLFVPGYLLDGATIKTMEAFKQLKELHAPFSGCGVPLLTRLSKLEQLRSLTVGIDPNVPQDVKKLAERFITNTQHLRTLQLFIFDQRLFETPSEQTVWREKLQQMLANEATLHLVVLPER